MLFACPDHAPTTACCYSSSKCLSFLLDDVTMLHPMFKLASATLFQSERFGDRSRLLFALFVKGVENKKNCTESLSANITFSPGNF